MPPLQSDKASVSHTGSAFIVAMVNNERIMKLNILVRTVKDVLFLFQLFLEILKAVRLSKYLVQDSNKKFASNFLNFHCWQVRIQTNNKHFASIPVRNMFRLWFCFSVISDRPENNWNKIYYTFYTLYERSRYNQIICLVTRHTSHHNYNNFKYITQYYKPSNSINTKQYAFHSNHNPTCFYRYHASTRLFWNLY